MHVCDILIKGGILISRVVLYTSVCIHVSLVPRPHPQEGKCLGTLEHFLGRAHHHVTACAPIQIYADDHMIAELAEPRIGANIPRPFLHVCGGVWKRDYIHVG